MPTLKEIKKNLPEDTPERRAEVLRDLQESLARNREALYRHAEKERTAILEELAGLEVTLKQSGIESVEDPKEVFQALLLLADHPVASVQKAAKRTLKAFHAATKKDDSGLSKLGDEVPYRTSLEIRALVHALVEGPQGKNWNESEGEIALIHNAPEELLQTKFTGAPMLQWWQFQLSNDNLREFLGRLGPDAALCLQVCLHMAVENDRVTVETDELIRGVGWNPRSTVERRELRRKVWTWMTCFANMAVIGARPGKWKDELTKKTLDLRSKDPLIAITGTREPIQQTLDGSEAPTEISFVAGEWLMRFKGNRQVLQDLGNTRKIASIPGGKPSGAWARAYAMVLLQFWREAAATAAVSHPGDENRLTVKLPTITREELHRRCPQKPYLQELLDGDKPHRAIEYDRDAWDYLQEVGIIATDPKNLTFKPKTRKGWKADFLTEELALKPGPDILEQVADIRTRAVAAQKKTKSR